MDSDSDSEDVGIHPQVTPKRKRDKSNWKSTAAAKKKRLEKNVGCVIKCKHTADHKTCKIRSVSVIDVYNFHEKYQSIGNSVDERKFIQRCRTISVVNSGRVRVDRQDRLRSQRHHTIECYIQTEKGRVPVCKEAFLGILSIGRSKLELAAKSMLDDQETMTERRGGSKPKLVKLKDAVINDIKSYRARETHYGRGDVVHRVYLSGELSVKKIYENFVKKISDELLKNCKYH